MHRLLLALLLVAALPGKAVQAAGAEVEDTPYAAQAVVFEFFYNDPAHMAPALDWLRNLHTTLTSEPYGHAPDDLSIKVVVHGTEIVTLAQRNYRRYGPLVERMRYYAELGVEFRVCALTAEAYGYRPEELYEFVQVVPSAMAELAHWQARGHALLQPLVLEKRFSVDEIR